MDDDKTDKGAIVGTVETATAQVSETLAPGSTRTVEDTATDSGLSVDAIREIVREEIEKNISTLQTVVPPVVEDDEEKFKAPTRKPWTHRGSR